MHHLISIVLFLFFTTTFLHGQSSGFHFQIDQGISALNDFNMKRDAGAFGGYATSLGVRLQDQPGETDFVLVKQREALQAATGLRFTYGLRGR